MTRQPDLQNVLRGGIAIAVWIALVLLLMGSVWELRSGAAEGQAPPAPTYDGSAARTAPLLAQLAPEVSDKLRKGTYARLIDEARRRVRAWEKLNVK